MPVRIETITMDCRDERSLSAFWSGALGDEVAVDQPGGWMVPRDPSGTGPRIGLQVVPEPKVVKNRVHLNLIPTGAEAEVACGSHVPQSPRWPDLRIAGFEPARRPTHPNLQSRPRRHRWRWTKAHRCHSTPPLHRRRRRPVGDDAPPPKRG